MRAAVVLFCLLLLFPLWLNSGAGDQSAVWAESSSQRMQSGGEIGSGAASKKKFAADVFGELPNADDPTLSCPEFYGLLRKNKDKLNFNCLSDSQFTSVDLWINDETSFWELIELMGTNICYVDTLNVTTSQDFDGSPMSWPIMEYFSDCLMYSIVGNMDESDGKTLEKWYPAVDLSLLNEEVFTLNLQWMNIIDISEIYEFSNLGFLSLYSCIYEGELDYSRLESVRRLDLNGVNSTIDFERFRQMPNLEILTVREVGGVKNFHAIEQLQAEIICVDESLYFSELEFIEKLKKTRPDLKVISGWD